ncbi:acyl-CoA dehydrogenase family protein [Ureibacillus sp. NPDC094379]
MITSSLFIEEQQLFKRKKVLEKVREIGEEVIGEFAQKVDLEQRYPFESFESLRSQNLQVLTVPTSYGGLGAGFKGDLVLLPLVLMEIASWCSSSSQVFALHNSAVQFIHAFGTDEQKDFFFNEIKNGAFFGSFGSEANRDGVIKNKLTPVENGFLLNGEKIFATGSPGAKWAIWRAVYEDPTITNGEPFALPIVDLSSRGIEIIDNWDGMGQRGTGSGKVIAKDVFIDKRFILANDISYQKYDSFFSSLFHVNFAAQFVGIAKGALRKAKQYVKKYIKDASNDPIIQLRVGELSAKIKAAEQITIYAANKLQDFNFFNNENSDEIVLAAAQAKVISTETVLDVTNKIFQVMGARSATNENGFDLYYRNARTLTLHDRVDRQSQLAGKIELD